MSYIIVRTEVFDGEVTERAMNVNGFFNNCAKVMEFALREDAEEWMETEKCDPVYDKPFMGECTFEVKEVN